MDMDLIIMLHSSLPLGFVEERGEFGNLLPRFLPKSCCGTQMDFLEAVRLNKGTMLLGRIPNQRARGGRDDADEIL